MKHWTLFVTYPCGLQIQVPFDQYTPTEHIREDFVRMYKDWNPKCITHWIAPHA